MLLGWRKEIYVCESCIARRFSRARTINQPSTHHQSARPAFQRLSKDTAKPWISKPNVYKGSQGSGSQFVPSWKKITPRAPRVSLGRMTKTGVSVLSQIPIHERTASKSLSKGSEDFTSLRLTPNIEEAITKGVLKDLEYAGPANIQRLAIPPLVQSFSAGYKDTFLLAAETGSGKTLAYLAPIVQQLKSDETEAEYKREAGRPRAVILLPSSELVKQVGATVKSMSHVVKLSSAALLPEFNFRRTKNEVLMSPIDILVTMPSKLSNLISEGIVTLRHTKFLVVDEADTMLDTSFQDLVLPIIKSCQSSSIIFCSATIPRSMDSFVRKTYPECVRLVSSKLHAVPRRIAMKFVDVEKEFKGNKILATHQILKDLANDDSEPGKVKKVILFVNKRETIPEMCEYLAKVGIETLPFSRDVPGRTESINTFLTKDEPIITPSESAETPASPFSSMKVLVTTDLASRGIDTIAVKNVILHDAPYSTIDFLHRVGRTGRAGRRGRAFILISKSRGQAWVKEIKELAISGKPLQ